MVRTRLRQECGPQSQRTIPAGCWPVLYNFGVCMYGYLNPKIQMRLLD